MEETYRVHLVQLPGHLRVSQKLKLLRALSKCLLNSDRPGASTMSPGSLLQCLTTYTINNFFLMASLNLCWGSFVLSCTVTSLPILFSFASILYSVNPFFSPPFKIFSYILIIIYFKYLTYIFYNFII